MLFKKDEKSEPNAHCYLQIIRAFMGIMKFDYYDDDYWPPLQSHYRITKLKTPGNNCFNERSNCHVFDTLNISKIK